MRLKFGFVLGAFALAALCIAPTTSAQQGDSPTWVWVCHNGKVLLVSENSSHVRHNDPSDPHVPGFPPSQGFLSSCGS